MEGSEELRETLVEMRREVDILRTETTHANLLLSALDAVLCVDGDNDPFAGVFSALMPVFDYSCAIVLVERRHGDDSLECVASSQPAAVGSIWKITRLFGKALSGRIVTTVSDGGPDECPGDFGINLSGVQPALYLPLGIRNRRGLMMLLRSEDQPGFDRAHVAVARKFSLLASHALAASRANQTEAESNRLQHLTEQLKISQEALRFRANFDALTGLPNRTHIQELVDDLIRTADDDRKVAFAFLDLDDFKQVNDHHGHAIGDELLRQIAKRVKSEIRSTDIFGRISGDEFVIILNPVDQRSDASALISRVRSRLKRPFRIEGVGIKTSASIGVALYPDHGRDYDTLRRHADMAMYRAKSSSKGGVAFFNRTLGRRATEKLSLERCIRGALSNREFRCALQQKVDFRTRTIVGFEALSRWVDQSGAVHAPGEFLPLASELGVLDGITHLIVDDLIQHLPELDAKFGLATKYSINISAAQSMKMPFMLKLAQRIYDTGQAGRVILELTEESFAAIGPFQTHVLPMLREAGVSISIDDFGTGYSSLAKLADLTVDELKIDRSLVSSIHQRPRNQSILRAIESLGSALSVSVVAEGIETLEEQDYLINQTRLRLGQGYLFHKPEFIADLIAGDGGTRLPERSLAKPSSSHAA
ncbi:ggdef domain [Afipia carboxidovorans OM5]|uniref:GGDEF/EAL domain protein n=1 Tax=Afipia carboxidovorans (strain ATCC 49405 / DSM 1227 / KCTC 32145 / OM5) TaxID=504832 RepID=B6JJL4_AFIC5|nr:EAL domain-containing protein [Afipia carboxidovorans]ACI94608.1 ggdef domain [Afipia carboxidovorans OM5]AEI01780.1 GGDEF/EAL domain protein [Afipia carboxidovorans OM4]AEI05355.1 GGDEF/EAL domain protein [Afipia carboxidovorans OM5]